MRINRGVFELLPPRTPRTVEKNIDCDPDAFPVLYELILPPAYENVWGVLCVTCSADGWIWIAEALYYEIFCAAVVMMFIHMQLSGIYFDILIAQCIDQRYKRVPLGDRRGAPEASYSSRSSFIWWGIKPNPSKFFLKFPQIFHIKRFREEDHANLSMEEFSSFGFFFFSLRSLQI